VYDLLHVLRHNINHILGLKAWNVRELERRAGLRHGRVNNILRGRCPEVDALVAIAKASGKSLDWFITPHEQSESAAGIIGHEQQSMYSTSNRASMTKGEALNRLKQVIDFIEENWPHKD